MRYYLTLFLLVSLPCFAFDLDSSVSEVKAAIPSNDPFVIQQALGNLATAIAEHELNDGSLDRSPSPARQKTRDEIKQALLPIKDDLIAIASTNNTLVSSGAISLLGYSDGGSKVYALLKDTLTNTNDSGLAVSSLFTLDKLGLIDDAIQNIVTKRIADVDVNDNSGNSVPLGLISEAGKIPIPQALNTFIKVLESAPSIWGKAAAAEAIMRLGRDGASALPELEKQLALLKASHADFRAINRLTRAISVVKGEAKAEEEQTASAINPSATLQPSANAPTVPSVAPSQGIPSSPIESNTSIPLWIYGIILLSIACFGGLWFLFLREKNR